MAALFTNRVRNIQDYRRFILCTIFYDSLPGKRIFSLFSISKCWQVCLKELKNNKEEGIDQGWRIFFRSRANILNLKNKNILACHVLFTIRIYLTFFGEFLISM